jgi:hypothetical protein
MDHFSADADARIDGALTVLRALFLLNLVAVALFAQACPALADGGILQLQRASGPFVITVFTAPAPLRVGPADISIMVQDSGSYRLVLDAEVAVSICREGGGETVEAEARRERSKNKLLYAALLSPPEEGRWMLAVTVVNNSQKTRISGPINVAPRRSFLLTCWWTLVLPPIAIALFVINQWRKKQ